MDENNNFFLFNNKNTKEIIVSFPSNSEAGITLKNNDGPGIKISKLSLSGRAKIASLNVGDIVLSLNNVPCINHKQAIAIVDECMFSNKNLKCVIIN